MMILAGDFEDFGGNEKKCLPIISGKPDGEGKLKANCQNYQRIAYYAKTILNQSYYKIRKNRILWVIEILPYL